MTKIKGHLVPLVKRSQSIVGIIEAVEQKTEREYPIPIGILKMDVPESWRQEIGPSNFLPPAVQQIMPTINYISSTEHQFKVLVTIFWNIERKPDFNNPEKIRKITESVLEKEKKSLLSKSEETEIKLQKFSGSSNLGYFYSSIDKTWKPGVPDDFKCLTRGNVGVGDSLFLYFSIYTNDKDSEVLIEALEMFKNAKHESKPR